MSFQTISPSKFQDECHKQCVQDVIGDITIEDDVWIGTNVTILAGVTIGRGSVIGAGSVITKSIPPYSIAAGNPCKVIRKKFSKEDIIEREKTLYSVEKRLSDAEIENLF